MTKLKTRIARLFTIRTKFEAYMVIYALALGAADRGVNYIAHYPGLGGKLLALCCTGAVFIAGGRLIDSVELQAQFEP